MHRHMNSRNNLHPGWQTLIEWLTSRGMDVSPGGLLVEARQTDGAGYGLYATKDCSPSTSLFVVPANALMNIKTLAPLYPKAKRKLSAVQLVSLHLSLHRPQGNVVSNDASFGPYISILPRNFDSHPLTWFVKHQTGRASEAEVMLLQKIPNGVLSVLKQMSTRYDADRNACHTFLLENASLLKVETVSGEEAISMDSSWHTEDFLWGWLNVNTRCIYQRLMASKSDPDNLTMCPILDFANHRSSGPHTYPTPTDADIWERPPRKKANSFGLSSPLSQQVRAGEELFLRYGSHSNRILFTEYGFVQGIPSKGFSLDFSGDINLSPTIEELFVVRGKLGNWMEQVLRDEGYWGDWTMHAEPAPAHPSFRVVVALRLYCSFSDLTPNAVLEVDSSALEQWRDTLSGKSDLISPENEAAWQKVLLDLCGDIEGTAKRAIDAEWKPSDVPMRFSGMCDNVVTLWKEEGMVASAVADSLRRGENF